MHLSLKEIILDTERKYIDVLIIGAGISGISAAWHLQEKCPDKSFTILEARENLGGTWDLFRYPGVRSDSDMYTLGFVFQPWEGDKSIADGKDILAYLRKTAEQYDISGKISYRQQVRAATWSSDRGTWLVDVMQPSGETTYIECSFLFGCMGYYDYDEGYTPDFPGRELFKGEIVHPQKWTEDIDYEDKRVIVIGSGATAITMVPAMTDKAKHVTMLQRSPTYIYSMPSKDAWAIRLKKILPARWTYALIRWKHIMATGFWGVVASLWPEHFAKALIAGVSNALGKDFDIAKHFTPKYKPWEQRVCMATEGDLFKVLKDGRASIVTDHVDSFTEDGIRLKSGETLQADMIVTATGLKMKMLGGIKLTVDDEEIDLAQTTLYKAMMFSDVPNLLMFFGYTAASWTLKIDLTASYACRLLSFMEKHDFDRTVPRKRESDIVDDDLLSFSSGYVQRAKHIMPKQGVKVPWRIHQNYFLDSLEIGTRRIDDGILEFDAIATRRPAK